MTCHSCCRKPVQLRAERSIAGQINALVIALLLLVGASSVAPAQDVSRSRIVEFPVSASLKLNGTLTVPNAGNGSGPFPAVLLLQGSGPVDRDGNSPPALHWATLEILAQELAAAGVASLRFDKRGMHANQRSLPTDTREWANFFRWENFVEDARAAGMFLRSQSEIDAARVAIVGHSEGGLIALALANAPDAAFKATVLLATPGRPLGDVITEQLTSTLLQQNAGTELTAALLAKNAEILQSIQATGAVPGNVPAELQALYPPYLGAFLHALLAIKPTDLARSARSPILAIHGGADRQVSADGDGRLLSAALSARQDPSQQVTLAGVNHALQATAEVTTERRPLDREVVLRLHAWLAAGFATSP